MRRPQHVSGQNKYPERRCFVSGIRVDLSAVVGTGSRNPVSRAAEIGRHAEPIAQVVRTGVVESVHLGHVVAIGADGAVVLSAGDPAVTVLPRSTLKPLQVVAMLRAGLDLDGPLLALAAASHSGEPWHLGGVEQILAGAGLTLADLRNTPDFPLDVYSAARWRAAGRPAERQAQNCSGKHAAMLATCTVAGWDIATHLQPDHPLQRGIRGVVEELTGVRVAHVAVDGCGAPLFSTTLVGLARAYGRIATARPDTPEGLVAAAMRAHPQWLSGTDRDVVRLASAVPGMLVKDGMEGVLAAALPDGRSLAVKVLDGSPRPFAAVTAAVVRRLGEAAVAPGAAETVEPLVGDPDKDLLHAEQRGRA
jgi:L-asparaginase II